MYSSCIVCGSQHLTPLIWLDAQGQPSDMVCETRTVDLCAACGHAQLEKYSYDGWPTEDEPVMIWWYAIPPADAMQLRKIIKGCPDPQNPKCDCSIHATLRPSAEKVYGGPSYGRYHWAKLEGGDDIPRLVLDDTKPAKDIAPRKQHPPLRVMPAEKRTNPVQPNKSYSDEDIITGLYLLAAKGMAKTFGVDLAKLLELSEEKMPVRTLTALAMIGAETEGERELAEIYRSVLVDKVSET